MSASSNMTRIAVVGGEGGDPREWWTAIQHLASQQKSAS